MTQEEGFKLFKERLGKQNGDHPGFSARRDNTGLSWDTLGHEDSTKALCPVTKTKGSYTTKFFKEVGRERRLDKQNGDQSGFSARRDNPKMSWDNMGRNFQEFFCPVLQKKESYTTKLFKEVDDYRERLSKQPCNQPGFSAYLDESLLESLWNSLLSIAEHC